MRTLEAAGVGAGIPGARPLATLVTGVAVDQPLPGVPVPGYAVICIPMSVAVVESQLQTQLNFEAREAREPGAASPRLERMPSSPQGALQPQGSLQLQGSLGPQSSQPHPLSKASFDAASPSGAGPSGTGTGAAAAAVAVAGLPTAVSLASAGSIPTLASPTLPQPPVAPQPPLRQGSAPVPARPPPPPPVGAQLASPGGAGRAAEGVAPWAYPGVGEPGYTRPGSQSARH
ncbi:hypothetical protein HYH03_002819 [Edaphochlamys debaryana]|uniref:Uncharacterized protein n=1 Tax=Edaphochlamys debaryana TaxID=47281 RepID=A0A836C3W4_9CHLO|nr:hypothetical protein HYH03_002819 [Edaphochlamys debaryana]|eukprot:KAG2499240.1 hypothetical protein HYH03_002819 [Edaphochlamys debaryana]